MGVSEELNGIVTITVAVIIITGVVGNVLADFVYKLFHVTHPVAKGVGLGTSRMRSVLQKHWKWVRSKGQWVVYPSPLQVF